jgi:DNA-binding transcriptional regulator LsrR (DeoR family)
MLVDGAVSVSQIADSMFQSNERVVDLLKWAASKGIVKAPLCDEVTEAVTESKMGRFVKCPKFMGDLSKIKGGDIEILRLCDGKKTTEEIAASAGVQNSQVIQIIARNKKHGIKMIGKTV